MPIMEGTTVPKTWTGDYSFAVDGGAATTIVLRSNDGPIPAGSYITGGILEVTTALDSSGSATAAVQVVAANDTVTQTAFGSSPWSSTGRKSVIPAGTGVTSLKTTTASSPSLVVGTAALTAGVFKLHLNYK